MSLERLMAMVRREARRLARRLPTQVDVNDLIGDGFVGLADALRRRNMNDSDFVAYATVRVRGEMRDALRKLDRVGRAGRAYRKRRAIASRCLAMGLGREPTEEETADRIGVTLADLRLSEQRFPETA